MAGHVLAGIALSLLAAALYNIGVALQALDARELDPSSSLELSLLPRLLRRKRWLLGTLLGFLAFPAQALAFAQVSLPVVQGCLALGLVLLLAIGHQAMHEPVGRREIVAVVGIVVGVALMTWGAPGPAGQRQDTGIAIALMAVLTLVALAPFVVPHHSSGLESALTVGAGVGFAASNIATKLFTDGLKLGHTSLVAIWLLVSAITAIVGVQDEMAAFQRRPATRIVPIVFALQTLGPILLAPIFLRERWATIPFLGIPLAAGFLLVLAGTIELGRGRAVGSLAAGGANRPD